MTKTETSRQSELRFSSQDVKVLDEYYENDFRVCDVGGVRIAATTLKLSKDVTVLEGVVAIGVAAKKLPPPPAK